MEDITRTKFYEDAARYGAFLGVAEVVFTALETWKPSSLLSLAEVVVFITLLVVFTKRRTALYGNGENGYSYGKCLKFIICMSAFAGVLLGAYAIVASNFLYPEKYHELIDKTVGALAQTGLYAGAMLERVKELYEKMFFSPLWVVLTNVLSMVIKGLFFGLFVAAYTRREPQLFGGKKEDNDELV